ncbi:MAG: pyruvate kinase [Methylococcaceae bacterium]|nr:pyruvate kinase [Methylococcaceae bacterium]
MTIQTNKIITEPQDSYQAILMQLLEDISQIRDKIVGNADNRLLAFAQYYRAGVYTKSATNLAHYLALRQFDLRHLQTRLSQAGLSSLGRAEASVLSTLDAVIDMLQRATNRHYKPTGKNPSEFGFTRGQQLLEQHTVELFGPYYEKSKAHVMVTLASDAAWNYNLIGALLNKGMTCARINCAHDDAIIWQAMIRNVRRAEVEMGRPCRILMDLAGHKIRTGEIRLGPPVHHIKIKKNALGQTLLPGRLMLINDQQGLHEENGNDTVQLRVTIPEATFKLLRVGHCLAFKDARGKERHLVVESPIADYAWLVYCDEGSYLVSGCDMALFRQIPQPDDQPLQTFKLGEFNGKPEEIRVFKDELLLLTTEAQVGAPAEYDDKGKPLKPAQIACTLSSAITKLRKGQPVWIDDGKVGAVVEKVNTESALLKVTQVRSSGVTLKGDKGINFPDTDLNLPTLSDKDLIDLDFACIHADLIGFSFVESLADMERLIDELAKRSATDLPIIAKIETNKAVKNLPEIILGTIGRHSLGIMIARGDLAVELGSARLAEIQEEMLWLCEAAHVPVIWATQVLESIAKKGTKSRPEFTDAAMAVRAECVMLNKGPYILDALEALINVMIRMQEHQHKKFPRLRALHW